MKRIILIAIPLLFLTKISFAQSKQTLDSLLLPLYNIKDSKKISNAKQAKQIIGYGQNALMTLSTYFTDTSKTSIKSDCQNTTLTKGEVAIILADFIERMPYFTLTNFMNCRLQFCKDNPNLIEFYVFAIRRDVKLFKQKYTNWLTSNDRKESNSYIVSSKKNKRKTDRN